MVVKLVQPLKAPPYILSPPMDVTLWGIVIEVKLVQRAKVPLPIEVTLSGMVIEVRALQAEKAPLPI